MVAISNLIMKNSSLLLALASTLAIAAQPFAITASNAQPTGASTAKVIYPVRKASPAAQEVEALGQTWGQALASRDAKRISSLYDPEAILLATLSNKLSSETDIFNYFTGLTKREGLKVRFDQQNIRILDEDTATNSGLYTFSYVDNGKTVDIPARYTFIYEKRGDKWMIIEHHSSVRPEKAGS
jgi:uncharacterized protein (TIGR02246 family)